MKKTAAVAGVAACLMVMGLASVGMRVVRAQERAARFEVVSIRPGDNGPRRFVTWGPTPSGYHTLATPLATVILAAYLEGTKMDFTLPSDRVKGAPAWVTEDGYDIEAKADEATVAALKGKTTSEQIELERPMLRALLEERFKLSAHVVSMEVPGYALVVSKRGMKMREAAPGEPLPAWGMSAGGGKSGALMSADHKPISMRYAQITMVELTTILSNARGLKPVVDQTGLTGRFSFELPFAAVDSPDGESRPASDPNVDIAHRYDWGAVGLEMKPIKAPVMMVVVDHVERPSEN